MFNKSSIVPVVMFHSVGIEKSQWNSSHLSEPLNVFEKKIAKLSSLGYKFIFWQTLYNHMRGIEKLKSKSIMLNFDDGYLDNWVYVFPILKKYNAKATIFVNPDFVDPNGSIRPNLEDVWSQIVSENDLQKLGFLNWKEMRIMETSGIVDIQSHALTHTRYFSGFRLIDFHKPGNRAYPWMAWNMRPEIKPFYMENQQEDFIPLGTPIYEHRKALVCKRYYPPKIVSKKVIDFVQENGGENFFQQIGWEKRLTEYHNKLLDDHADEGYFESRNDYNGRIYHELKDSKIIIEKKLNKKVDFICWPGGAYNSTVTEIAKKVGYKAWTLSSRDKGTFRNCLGSEPTQIKRIGPFHKYRWRGRYFGLPGVNYFMARIRYYEGSYMYGLLSKGMLLLAIITAKLTDSWRLLVKKYLP